MLLEELIFVFLKKLVNKRVKKQQELRYWLHCLLLKRKYVICMNFLIVLQGVRVLRWVLAHHFRRLLGHFVKLARNAPRHDRQLLLSAVFDQVGTRRRNFVFSLVLQFASLETEAPEHETNGEFALDLQQPRIRAVDAEFTPTVLLNAAPLLRFVLTSLFHRSGAFRTHAADVLGM